MGAITGAAVGPGTNCPTNNHSAISKEVAAVSDCNCVATTRKY